MSYSVSLMDSNKEYIFESYGRFDENYELMNLFKSLATEKKVIYSDKYFTSNSYTIPSSSLIELQSSIKAFKQEKFIKKIINSNNFKNNFDQNVFPIELLFNNNILSVIDNLKFDYYKYEDLNPKVVKELRKADWEIAEKLEKEYDLYENKYNKLIYKYFNMYDNLDKILSSSRLLNYLLNDFTKIKFNKNEKFYFNDY